MSNTTKRIKCKCIHAEQDRRYGASKRLHNRTGSLAPDTWGWRCTVCEDNKLYKG